jgi:2-amino-4-hydroxy-6-hydroxymethyldihydropteridine diphosphokinase
VRQRVTALVALGSNLGDRRANLESAVQRLREDPCVEVLAVSPWVETDAEGGPPEQPAFLNGAVQLGTTLTCRELFALLQEIERALGRDRVLEVPHGPRTVDLDLLLFGDEVIRDPDLVVPHPRMEQRVFVLEPVACIAPRLTLPGCGLTVEQRLAQILSD